MNTKMKRSSMHHYITKYTENGNKYVEAWLQINLLFGKYICFSKRKIKI